MWFICTPFFCFLGHIWKHLGKNSRDSYSVFCTLLFCLFEYAYNSRWISATTNITGKQFALGVNLDIYIIGPIKKKNAFVILWNVLIGQSLHSDISWMPIHFFHQSCLNFKKSSLSLVLYFCLAPQREPPLTARAPPQKDKVFILVALAVAPTIVWNVRVWLGVIYLLN